MTGIYTQGKQNIGNKKIDLLNDTFIAVLVDTSIYIPDLDVDEFQSDIPESAVIIEKTLTGTSWVDSVFNANDIVFTQLESTQLVGAIVIIQYKETLNDSALIFINDDAPSFPLQPDGTDLTVSWDNTDNKIFKL